MAEAARQEPRIAVAEAVADDRLQKATAYIEEEEGATSRYRGWLAQLTTALLVGMSVFHLYAAVAIVPAQVLRPVHVGWTLLLVFLLFPVAARFRNRLMWWDVVCAALGVATIVYLLAGGDDIWDRNTVPNRADVFFGVTFVLLVLEAVRRTSGWILLFVIGSSPTGSACGLGSGRTRTISQPLGIHVSDARGISAPRSTCVIAHHPVHDLRRFPPAPGAGNHSIELAAMGSRPAAPGALSPASFLLGGPSSGVATTVTIGSVAYLMLQRAGYGADAAGASRRRRFGRHLASGAGRRGVPDRGFLNQLSRRVADGDGATLLISSLFLMVGLTRKVRRPDIAVAVEGRFAPHQALLVLPSR
jgi:hypothetical protein